MEIVKSCTCAFIYIVCLTLKSLVVVSHTFQGERSESWCHYVTMELPITLLNPQESRPVSGVYSIYHNCNDSTSELGFTVPPCGQCKQKHILCEHVWSSSEIHLWYTYTVDK